MFSNKTRIKNEDFNEIEEAKKEKQELELITDHRLLLISKADQAYYPATLAENLGQVSTQDDTFITRTKRAKGLNQDSDAKLPITFHEREIMENVEASLVTLICGETGSGKSTQIP